MSQFVLVFIVTRCRCKLIVNVISWLAIVCCQSTYQVFCCHATWDGRKTAAAQLTLFKHL